MNYRLTRWIVTLILLTTEAALLIAQTPLPGATGARGGAAAAGRGGRGGAPAPPTSTVPQITRSPAVDAVAADQGRALWTANCITCHGTQARGTDQGPNLIRSQTVNEL